MTPNEESTRRMWGDIGTLIAVIGAFVADFHSMDVGMFVSIMGLCVVVLSVFLGASR